MKLWNFKYVTILAGIVLSLLYPVTSLSQNTYDERIERYRNKWSSLIPTHEKIQYAGGMGFLSAGVGWDYGRNNQWETDVLLGFLPKFSTDNAKVTFTLKQNFIPWKKAAGEVFIIEPFACGLYFTSILDDDFWFDEPDKYPNGYYWFSTKMRFNIYLGQRITYKIPHEKSFLFNSITAFYELSSNDLYLQSAFANRYLRPSDYLRLSFGLKFQLF
jgi:hypothetical protein